MSGSGYLKFRNDRGIPEICIGVREFECIGESPPQDHRTSTSIWARPARPSVPTAGRGSASILDWHRSMPRRRTVYLLTKTRP